MRRIFLRRIALEPKATSSGEEISEENAVGGMVWGVFGRYIPWEKVRVRNVRNPDSPYPSLVTFILCGTVACEVESLVRYSYCVGTLSKFFTHGWRVSAFHFPNLGKKDGIKGQLHCIAVVLKLLQTTDPQKIMLEPYGPASENDEQKQNRGTCTCMKKFSVIKTYAKHNLFI